MIEVHVDGKHLEPSQLEMHFQKVPYPGGSRYRFRCTDADLSGAVSERFQPSNAGVLDPNQAAMLFNLVRMHIAMTCGRAVPKYWANTVDMISIDGDIMEIEGACSPHVA